MKYLLLMFISNFFFIGAMELCEILPEVLSKSGFDQAISFLTEYEKAEVMDSLTSCSTFDEMPNFLVQKIMALQADTLSRIEPDPMFYWQVPTKINSVNRNILNSSEGKYIVNAQRIIYDTESQLRYSLEGNPDGKGKWIMGKAQKKLYNVNFPLGTGSSGTLVAWDLSNGSKSFILNDIYNPFASTVSPNEQFVAYINPNNEVMLYCPSSLEEGPARKICLSASCAYNSCGSCAFFSPNNEFIVTQSNEYENSLLVWPHDGSPARLIPHAKIGAFNKDSSIMAAASHIWLGLYNTQDFSLFKSIPISECPYALHFSLNQEYIALEEKSNLNNKFKIVNIKNGTDCKDEWISVYAIDSTISRVVINGDYPVAPHSKGSNALLKDLETQQEIPLGKSQFKYIHFDPTGHYLVHDYENYVCLRHAKTGGVIGLLPHEIRSKPFFSGDGKKIFTFSGNDIKIWSLFPIDWQNIPKEEKDAFLVLESLYRRGSVIGNFLFNNIKNNKTFALQRYLSTIQNGGSFDLLNMKIEEVQEMQKIEADQIKHIFIALTANKNKITVEKIVSGPNKELVTATFSRKQRQDNIQGCYYSGESRRLYNYFLKILREKV